MEVETQGFSECNSSTVEEKSLCVRCLSFACHFKNIICFSWKRNYITSPLLFLCQPLRSCPPSHSSHNPHSDVEILSFLIIFLIYAYTQVLINITWWFHLCVYSGHRCKLTKMCLGSLIMNFSHGFLFQPSHNMYCPS